MGRPRPMNGTVGATKKKLEQVKKSLEEKNYEEVGSFLNEAIDACDGEYVVIVADGEIIKE